MGLALKRREGSADEVAFEEHEADEPGSKTLKCRDAAFGTDPAPGSPAVDELRGCAGGYPDQRSAQEACKDDNGSRHRIPAARAELDDGLAGYCRQRNQHDRDRE